jgi:hypothetical protein
VNTEVEAKFSVSDAITFDRLLVISELDGYALRPARTAEVVDRYYDTAEAALLRGITVTGSWPGWASDEALEEGRRKGWKFW